MELPCIVERLIFCKDNGFAILAANLNPESSKYEVELEDIVDPYIKKDGYNNFTVTLGSLDPHEKVNGGQFIFIGDFVDNPKFGKQFRAEFYYRDAPTTEDGLRAYLMTLPNIKDRRSLQIIRRFGVSETIRILDEDPMRLKEISGLTEKRILVIAERWKGEKDRREVYMWLSKHGISPEIGKIIYDKWQDQSLKILTDNPYCLTEIKGVEFGKADSIAHKIFDEVPKDHRTSACMKYILTQDLNKNSNLCMPYASFKREVVSELGKSNESLGKQEPLNQYYNLIPKCIKSDLDSFAAVQNIHEKAAFIYLREIWDKEKFISQNIFHKSRQKVNHLECSVDDLIDAQRDVGEFSHRQIELDDCQKEAIKSAFEHKVTVITGAGGTGKSTIARCIFYLAEKKKLRTRMMSPTGKAAQVLAAKTFYPAETIHRSLKLKPGNDLPGEKIAEDMIIIDEISMVGIDTMFAIMVAMEENIWGNIVFIGDANQLPSVSPGNFLSDIIKSGCVNVVRLDKIHRQDEDSYISLLANEISRGKIVTIPENASDMKWHDINSTQNFDDTIRGVVREFIDNGNNLDDLQIISPMYKCDCGVNKINEAIQDLMKDVNGTKDNFLARGFVTFYIGDRVIQTVNNYDKSIFNGDMGRVVGLGRKVVKPDESDEEDDYITVNFYGRDHVYFGKEIEQLKLAWVITVHKFQGSSSPYVIFVMANEARILMSKELLYTALTRAEKRVDIYGHISMFKLAPTKSIVKKRYTNMNNLIIELKESRKIFEVLSNEENKKT
jgi:exodeoxyribonuclease V alpha subunit